MRPRSAPVRPLLARAAALAIALAAVSSCGAFLPPSPAARAPQACAPVRLDPAGAVVVGPACAAPVAAPVEGGGVAQRSGPPVARPRSTPTPPDCAAAVAAFRGLAADAAAAVVRAGARSGR